MFKTVLKSDFFNLLIENNKIIKSDRKKYKPIMDEIKMSVFDDPLVILSDTNLLIKENIDYEVLSIYTTHARKIATQIANDLHKKFKTYVQMRCIVPIESYEIMYNMRAVTKIYGLERYKDVNLHILFNTVKINDLHYFPAEIELIDIYHKLYLPNFFDEQPDLLKKEAMLFDNINLTAGGAECIPCKKIKVNDINNIKILTLKFLDKENYILIGDVAYSILLNQTIDSLNVIQIISENSIEVDLHNIVNYLSKFTDYKISYKKKKLFVPKDNRLCKYIFYIKIPKISKNTSDKPFLEIYNSGQYEILPYFNKTYDGINLRFGISYINQRFLLIEIYLYNILVQIGKMDTTLFNAHKIRIIKTIKKIRKLKETDDIKYIGINYDEKIEQKITISENAVKKNSYFPALSFKKNKEYQLIATS
jgi:hypothetical protein